MQILLINHHRRFKSLARALPWGKELAARGHDVTVMCLSDNARFKTRVETAGNLRIVESPDLLAGSLRSGWDPVCALRRRLFLGRDGIRYDIIHCLDTRPATIWPALSFARAHNIPIVSDWIDWWGRGGLITEQRPRWYQLLFGGIETYFEEHYRPRLDGLTVISNALRDRAVKLGIDPARCKRIPGGADLRVFGEVPPKKACREALGIDASTPVVCFSGLDVLIDLPLALDAFRIVRQTYPEAALLLAGPTEDRVKNLTGGNALDGVRPLGRVPFEELPSRLAAADVFLMPYADKVSNVGRWPNKVGDYMAVGRPTVSNPVGEVQWLFETYNVGVLAEPAPERMAEAVVGLLRDPDRAQAIGAEARRVAETVFAWDKLILELESWYRDILKL